MLEVFERIHIASMIMGCPRSHCDPDWAVVHACKHPCHQTAVGYRGNLDKQDPNYLVLERDNDLYLNMIDPPKPLFSVELFEAAMVFADQRWQAGQRVLFHCNQGRSRAPSLSLLFAAKRRGFLPCGSYAEARQEFAGYYRHYAPGRGIEMFLEQNWNQL